MKQYLIFALIVAAAVGWGTWQKQKAANAKLEAEAIRASLSMAEAELQQVATLANHNKTVADSYKHEVIRQREIAAAEAKKSRQRLDAFNALNRKIANVTDNPPVPDAIELVLESVRLRGPVPGAPGADDGHKDRSGGEAGVAGRDVPAGTVPTAEAPGS